MTHACGVRSCGPHSLRECVQNLSRRFCRPLFRFQITDHFAIENAAPEVRKSGIFNCKVVGARGFVPPTPTTPLWCATSLRYAPTDVFADRTRSGHDTCGRLLSEGGFSAAQNLKNLFKFQA